MSVMDKFYEKVRGSYFALLSSVVFLISLLTASTIYYISDQSFSIITHWVSDLGEGPNFSNYVFNIGEISSGIISILFFIFLSRTLYKENKMRKSLIISFMIAVIASVGLSLAGAFPMYTTPLIHFTAAVICFIGFFISFSIYGYIESLIWDISKIYSLLSYITSLVIAIFMIIYLLDEVNIIRARELYLFLEWISVFLIIIWFLSQGILTLKK